MEVDDKLPVVIIKIMQIFLANRLAGVLLGDFEVGERFGFVILYDFCGIVGVVFVDVIAFRFEAQLLLHAGQILEEMLRSVLLGGRQVDCLIARYLHALDFIEDCLSVGLVLGLLSFLGGVIIFQKLPDTKIDVALVVGYAIDDREVH